MDTSELTPVSPSFQPPLSLSPPGLGSPCHPQCPSLPHIPLWDAATSPTFGAENHSRPQGSGAGIPLPSSTGRNVRHVVKHKSCFPELPGPISAAGADNEKGFQSQTTAPAEFPLLMNHPQAETQPPGPGCAHTHSLSPSPGTAALFAFSVLHPQPASAPRLCSIPGKQQIQRELRLQDVKMLLNLNINQIWFEGIFGRQAQENGHIKVQKVIPE